MPDAAAGPHPFETAGRQQARRSVRVLRNVGKSGDAGTWMEPEIGERFSLSVEEVKEYERFQKTAKVGRRHQACDRHVSLSTGASGDAGKRTLRRDACGQRTTSGFLRGFSGRHRLPFWSSVVTTPPGPDLGSARSDFRLSIPLGSVISWSQVHLRCLNRDIPSGPGRKLARLPAGYFVRERNSVVRIRT
jgi:hypothetical protein